LHGGGSALISGLYRGTKQPVVLPSGAKRSQGLGLPRSIPSWGCHPVVCAIGRFPTDHCLLRLAGCASLLTRLAPLALPLAPGLVLEGLGHHCTSIIPAYTIPWLSREFSPSFRPSLGPEPPPRETLVIPPPPTCSQPDLSSRCFTTKPLASMLVPLA
jgi:hypothetical protein